MTYCCVFYDRVYASFYWHVYSLSIALSVSVSLRLPRDLCCLLMLLRLNPSRNKWRQQHDASDADAWLLLRRRLATKTTINPASLAFAQAHRDVYPQHGRRREPKHAPDLYIVFRKKWYICFSIYFSQFLDKFYETFKQWHKLLAACVSAWGRHLEHIL